MSAELILAEDDRALRESLAAMFEEHGYVVRAFRDGARALAAFRAKTPDAVILDVMMPKMDGMEACRSIRETDAATPIIFLTALDSEEDELRGLGIGADDYVSKTASDDILLARIAAALRRADTAVSQGDFSFGPWRVEASRLCMTKKGSKPVAVSEREIALLRWFARHPGEVFCGDFLLTRFWPGDGDAVENMLYVALHKLREKLGSEGDAIVTIRGSGYAYKQSS